jgi:hypothetical protein
LIFSTAQERTDFIKRITVGFPQDMLCKRFSSQKLYPEILQGTSFSGFFLFFFFSFSPSWLTNLNTTIKDGPNCLERLFSESNTASTLGTVEERRKAWISRAAIKFGRLFFRDPSSLCRTRLLASVVCSVENKGDLLLFIR